MEKKIVGDFVSSDADAANLQRKLMEEEEEYRS
jgi:hypothetical protein